MAGTPESMAANQAAFAAAVENVRNVLQAAAAGAELALPDIGEAVVEEVHTLIGTPGPPRSEPGEPPHMDTGDLYDSFDYDVESDEGQVILTVGTPLDYAGFLEFGTSRMDARPFFRPAMDNLASSGRIEQMVRYAVAAAQSAALAAMGGQGE